MEGRRSAPARIADWLFRDRESGRIVIAQWPNAPLWLFAATASAAWAIDAAAPEAPAALRVGLWLTSRASLAWWATDEVLRGVNPWRRFLGATVLLVCAWSLASGV